MVVSAHPRSRGENPGKRGPKKCDRGSSPLTRGKPDRGQTGMVVRGLIPAHAGKPPSNVLLQHIMRLIPAHAGKTP